MENTGAPIMTEAQQTQQGFAATRTQMSRWNSFGSKTQRTEAHRIWIALGWTDSPYAEGSRKALRPYFDNGKPDPKTLRALRAEKRRP